MDYYTARQQFNNYLKDYDNHNDKIRLKIVHTYGIVKESTDISLPVPEVVGITISPGAGSMEV